jgi:hypothetical protein
MAVAFGLAAAMVATSAAALAASTDDETHKSRAWWKSDKSGRSESKTTVSRETKVRTYTSRDADRRLSGTYSGRGAWSSGLSRGGRLRGEGGPYTYVWTDNTGKYDYFADHYGYPYVYGGTPSIPPPNVFGYVPPEQAGGGPVLYHRSHTSW